MGTMTFNVFEMGSEEAVSNAFNILSNGGVVIQPIHEVPWSKCCATVIDKFGVCWWIAIDKANEQNLHCKSIVLRHKDVTKQTDHTRRGCCKISKFIM